MRPATPIGDAVTEALREHAIGRPLPVGSESDLQDFVWRAIAGFLPGAFKEPRISLPTEPTAHRHSRPDFAVASFADAAFIEVKLRDFTAGLRQLGAYMQSATTICGHHPTEAILIIGMPFSGQLPDAIHCPWAVDESAPLTVIDPFTLAQ